MDGEGNVVGHPMKRQDNKSCEPITGQTCISLPINNLKLNEL